jgi:hypothetical protein
VSTSGSQLRFVLPAVFWVQIFAAVFQGLWQDHCGKLKYHNVPINVGTDDKYLCNNFAYFYHCYFLCHTRVISATFDAWQRSVTDLLQVFIYAVYGCNRMLSLRFWSPSPLGFGCLMSLAVNL